ncbi:MAG: MATE efflux family protein, partial [uncultured bacterium]
MVENNVAAQNSASNTEIFQSLMKLGSPLILRGLIIAGLQFFLKRIILAKKDEKLLAMYSDISSIEGFIFVFLFSGLHVISTMTASINASGRDPERIGVLYRQGILFGLSLMIPTAALCASASTIFRITHQPEMTIRNADLYFKYSFFAYVMDVLYRAQFPITVGLSEPKSSLIADSAEAILDVLFTYLLINGKCGFPEMGVEGAALGYGLAASLTTLSYAGYLYHSPNFKKYKLFSLGDQPFFDWPIFKSILSNGFYTGLNGSLVYLTQMLTTFLCGASSQSALIGLEAAGSASYLIETPLSGFTEASIILIGRSKNVNFDYFKKVGNLTIFVGFAYSFLSAVTLLIFSSAVAQQFMPNTVSNREDFQLVVTFLKLQAVIEIVNGIRNTGFDVLSGCLDTKYPCMLGIGFIFLLNSILVAGSFYLSKQNPLAAFGVQLVGLTMTATGVSMRWKKQCSMDVQKAGFWNNHAHGRGIEADRHP